MVVMEEVSLEPYKPYADIRGDLSDKQRQAVRAELLKCLRLLHGMKMVHGDIRDINLLVCTEGTIAIKLIDFDWAGRVGDVRYPSNVNRLSVRRPETACDGALVLVEHDMEMLNFMIPSTSG